jgi:hypothetical protein
MRALVVALACALVLAGTGVVAQSVTPAARAADQFVPEGRLVYGDLSDAGGIYTGLPTCNPDCAEERLTSEQWDAQPAWSPTGRQVAFSRRFGDYDSLIFVLDIVANTVMQVTNFAQVDGVPVPTADVDPDWSPDGRTIVFSRSAEGSVGIAFVSPANPGAVRTLPSDPDGDGPYCSGLNVHRTDPTFSPDGLEIAYAANAIALPGSRLPGGLAAGAAGRRGGGAAAQAGGARADAGCPQAGIWVSSINSHRGERRIAAELGNAWAPAWQPHGSSIAMVTTSGVYIVPLDGSPTTRLQDDLGNVPMGTFGGPGMFGGGSTSTGRVGWDPGSRFLVLDEISGSGRPVKYKPDGSGDLDTAAGTMASQGYSVQCIPETCLTSLTVLRYVGGPGGQYPATFHYAGTLSGDITIAEIGYGVLSSRVAPGPATLTESTSTDWGLDDISCDAPAQVDLGLRSVSVEIGLGTTVTCIFSVDRPLPTETPFNGSTEPPRETPSRTSGDCLINTQYNGEWVAGELGVNTLHFKVSFPWCYGNGVVEAGPDVTVDQKPPPGGGGWVLPTWFQPITFKPDEFATSWSIEPTGPGRVSVYAEGSFLMCVNALDIALMVLGEKLWAEVGKLLNLSRFVPASVKRLIAKRILEPIDAWIKKWLTLITDLPDGGGVWVRQGLNDPKRVKTLEVVTFLLGAAFDKLRDVLVNEATALTDATQLLDVCRETWHAKVEIPLDPSGQIPPVVPDEGLQDFWWEVKQLRP